MRKENPTIALCRTSHTATMFSFRPARGFQTVATVFLFIVILVNMFLLKSYVFQEKKNARTLAYSENDDFTPKAGSLLRINPLDARAIVNHKPSSFNNENYYMSANVYVRNRKLMEERVVSYGVSLVDKQFDLKELALSDDWLRAAIGRPDVILLSCTEIDQIDDVTYLSRGWTKVVYSGVYRGQPVALKTVDVNGHDVTNCLAEGDNMTSCYGKSARKIVREIVLLSSLTHENVIKVLGFCIAPKVYDGHEITSVTMVTELGEPIDQIKLFQMSWEDRLRTMFLTLMRIQKQQK
ncbi:hypothetical protein Btru_066881 [Bulinus truncatus]|nr:hypothetical protein Btru_066881 [Bulinus truncatus]